jgi:hypothetical protein
MAILAAPLVIPFAEAIGLSVATLGIAKASDMVNDYIKENPEQSIKIFQMIMPSQGIANALKNKSSKDDEEVSEVSEDVEVEEKPKKISGKEKAMRIKEAIRRARAGKGNYSSPDAEGSAVDIRGSVIREVEDMGIADKNLKDNYNPDKPKFDYKKFFRNRKADGGAIGIEVLFEEKNPRQGLFMGGSPLTGQALSIYNSMNAYGFDDQAIADALQEQGLYTPGGTTDTPDTTPGQTYGIQSGSDNFSPYNPDPNSIKTVKQDPAIQANLEAIQRNQQLQSMGIQDPFAKEMDPANAYYGDMFEDTSNLTGKQSMFAKAKQGLTGLMDNPLVNLISSSTPFGMAKNLFKGIANKMPVNQRAIQENIMGNLGFAVNDIGQIVSTGDYNDPENVMAGYNLSRMTPQTFMQRIASIKNRKAAQTDASRRRIAAIEEAQRQFEAAEKLKRLAVEEARLKKGKAPGGGTWDGGGGPAYTGPGGVGGGQFTDSLGNTDYQDAYDPGGGEKDGGIIGYRKGGLATMFKNKR